MSKATEELMALLHGSVAQAFTDYLKKTKVEDLAPSMLGQIVTFLKHNHIELDIPTGDEAGEGTLMGELRKELQEAKANLPN